MQTPPGKRNLKKMLKCGCTIFRYDIKTGIPHSTIGINLDSLFINGVKRIIASRYLMKKRGRPRTTNLLSGNAASDWMATVPCAIQQNNFNVT